jgi:hypothetical protein
MCVCMTHHTHLHPVCHGDRARLGTPRRRLRVQLQATGLLLPSRGTVQGRHGDGGHRPAGCTGPSPRPLLQVGEVLLLAGGGGVGLGQGKVFRAGGGRCKGRRQ